MITILVLFLVQIILVLILRSISNLFNLSGSIISLLTNNKKYNIFLYTFLFALFFISLSILFYKYLSIKGLQIVNFIFSFIIIFEVCMKISNSERFINWIGDHLESSIRLLIMFIISLNCTYFFTRLTYQIIQSQNI